MTAYYNEFDPKAAAWLRELINDGLIAPGEVDERSIEDVLPSDLAGFRQCHFFAGIGGWSLALRLAGVPDDQPVWTGSCPCQPFSAAGKGRGTADERHLWPAFWWLIAQCGPARVFGEQVASGSGREWLAGVRLDLEELGYAVGAADLCAAGVAAPHVRQRLFWMADRDRQRCDGEPVRLLGGESRQAGAETAWRGHGCGVAHADGYGWLKYGRNAVCNKQENEPGQRNRAGDAGTAFWADSYFHPYSDGKSRRVPTEPSLFPLAHGVSSRVGLLRGAGNAIVSEVAAAFIKAAGGIE